ncbi:ABC transporter-related protein [Nostoc carneum NIES-2107]|nr:ABC transporter-related protein [Nostoc carneum NIES-2107]
MTISINEQEIAAKPQDNENDIVLSVNGVSKKFCRDLKRSLMYGVQDIASELLGLRDNSEKLRKQEFWALDNVSFKLRRGESVGLVGKNGSGKSTLLRIIAGLIKPDRGFVEVNGIVAPLIALGAGFNPILTGRENIYANMAILGLSKKEIDERFDEVVEFAEIGDAIDAPVQSYSSGMAARLGFASAIHTKPDILLIDEVLAVGDMKFRTKCYRKLVELRKNGTSFILVSHAANSLLAVCDSAVYISKGKFICDGKTELVLKKYEEDLFDVHTDEISIETSFISVNNQNPNSDFNITALYFTDEEGSKILHPVTGNGTYFNIECKALKNIENVNVTLLITEQFGEGESTLRLNSLTDNSSFSVSPGKFNFQIYLPCLNLKANSYSMKIGISQGGFYLLDAVESFKFKVISNLNMSECLFFQPREWLIKK